MVNFYDPDSYHFELPPSQIAQNPVEPRDHSRLLVADRKGSPLEDHLFCDLPDLLRPGDLLVLNDTKVIRARLRGSKKRGGAAIELLLLKPLDGAWRDWEALVRPGRRLPPGTIVVLPEGVELLVGAGREEGTREIRFVDPAPGSIRNYLDRHGEIPLPPYIRDSRAPDERYQTVYALEEGSAAAPTAGLHFTRSLLERIESGGVERAYVTLHVGLGTFRPVKEKDIRLHPMHEELCILSSETVGAVERTRKRGGRVIAVGTTVVRTLESSVDEKGILSPGVRNTRLFIYPGYPFHVIDGLITNFHLPKSTLLMLVAAFLGYERTFEAYERAVREGYRFFSFGDAMAIF